jgi:membrane-anchored protein YejM (alkaline phosphatase superfamily)
MIEKIVDKLKEQGEYENTMIIFTTDNGFFHGEHGSAAKWYPYQESISVPLTIRDPCMPQNKHNMLDDSYTPIRSILIWPKRSWGRRDCQLIRECKDGILRIRI